MTMRMDTTFPFVKNLSYFVEYRFCFAQILRIESLGERVVNLGEAAPDSFGSALILAEADETHHSAQLQGLRVLAI